MYNSTWPQLGFNSAFNLESTDPFFSPPFAKFLQMFLRSTLNLESTDLLGGITEEKLVQSTVFVITLWPPSGLSLDLC